jgi:dephospho-CoA kinase
MKHTINVNREVEVIKIALMGKIRSGKSTVSNHLYIRHSFNRVAFGDALKKNAHATFPWIYEWNKPRALYQQFGQLMRQIDPDVWIKHAEQAVKGAIDFRVNTGADEVGVVVTDCRQQNEVDWCRKNGFSIVRVVADDNIRLKRAVAAGDEFKIEDLSHETEQNIMNFEVDYEIDNIAGVEELKVEIDKILIRIKENDPFGSLG